MLEATIMGHNNLLETQIIVALRCLRVARFDGNPEAIHVAQHHFDRLLDRLCDQLAEAVSA